MDCRIHAIRSVCKLFHGNLGYVSHSFPANLNTDLNVRRSYYTQLVVMFVCIFLYRFGSPHPLSIGSICGIGKGTKARMSEEPVSFSFPFLIPEKHKTFSALLTCCVFSNLNYPFPYIIYIYLTLSFPFVLPCDSTGIVAFAINGSHVLLESYGDSLGGLDVRSHGKWRVDLDKLRLKRVVMALETLKSNAFSNFIIYDTISATPFSSHDYPGASFVVENMVNYQEPDPASAFDNCALMRTRKGQSGRRQNNNVGVQVQVQGRKKGRRKPRVCKNKEDAETQRMTHIAVERNRRKQMNEHLAVLRSLMPESFVQRV